MLIGTRIVAHELVTLKDQDGESYEMLKIKARGVDDKRSKFEWLVAPDRADEYPLAEIGEVSFTIRQQRMDLDDKPAKRGAAAKAH